MIICPNCKEEIDDDSLYCDQCGQMLLFCETCGHVGIGKRCTNCGGFMGSSKSSNEEVKSIPLSDLVLSNAQQGISMSVSNGDIIGRRVGVPKQLFENNMYISGQHAQFVYSSSEGWGVVDKNSSNGTMVNGNKLLPDKIHILKDGDLLMIANLKLQVSIV